MKGQPLKQLYYRLHDACAKDSTKGRYSSGFWQDAVRDKALALCAPSRGNLLEVGCGEGLFLMQLAGKNQDLKLWGIDNSKDRIQEAKEEAVKEKLPSLAFYEADAASLPFKENFFDTVVCINVLFNLPSWDCVKKVLFEMARVCKKQGRVIFEFRNSLNPLIVCKYSLARYYDETVKTLPLRPYRFSRFMRVAKECGLEIVNGYAIGFFFRPLAPIIMIEAVKR
ncbi:MAG: class I SAM-dependent methyltransferase [Candidatus Omnitrophica bacterium]|nr:class I SAM-dependent methyltransferase [Candidatus Omnitrophota bacterium]